MSDASLIPLCFVLMGPRIVPNVQEFFALMRSTRAILVGKGALEFLLESIQRGVYVFHVPYQTTELFLSYLTLLAGFTIVENIVYRGQSGGCGVNPRRIRREICRLVRLRSITSPCIRVFVAVTGSELVEGIASLPLAFTATTLSMNFLCADGFCIAYPGLTLRRRGWFQPSRASSVELCNSSERNFDMCNSARLWDLDRHGTPRHCSRSWLAPCVARSFGDGGCITVRFYSGSDIPGLGVGWLRGGAPVCPNHRRVVCQVHRPDCNCVIDS